jgi:hypothetical protein
VLSLTGVPGSNIAVGSELMVLEVSGTVDVESLAIHPAAEARTSEPSGAIFEANISNMTELALALTADGIEHCRPTVRHIHLRRIIEHIETNLADPTLNPTDIVRQHGFSSRC